MNNDKPVTVPMAVIIQTKIIAFLWIVDFYPFIVVNSIYSPVE